jgi:SAM-dependent methyltransferase
MENELRETENELRPIQDLGFVHEYYCQRRVVDGSPMSIYEIWEKGGAYNDSVTPSTYSADYRLHITGQLLALTRPGATVFSLGCGNGFVEADLAQQQRRVRAIDCNDEAVRLATSKGVEAFNSDFFTLAPDALRGVDLVYADGFLGHLFHSSEGLAPFLDKLHTLQLASGAWLVVSNDSPRDPEVAFCPHDRVRDFWFLSKSYLSTVLAEFGLRVADSYYFAYARPLSGLRNRTVCIAQVR